MSSGYKKGLMLFASAKDVSDKITAKQLCYDIYFVCTVGRFLTEAVCDGNITRIYFHLGVVTKKVV